MNLTAIFIGVQYHAAKHLFLYQNTYKAWFTKYFKCSIKQILTRIQACDQLWKFWEYEHANTHLILWANWEKAKCCEHWKILRDHSIPLLSKFEYLSKDQKVNTIQQSSLTIFWSNREKSLRNLLGRALSWRQRYINWPARVMFGLSHFF